jgi:hypothetical protein
VTSLARLLRGCHTSSRVAQLKSLTEHASVYTQRCLGSDAEKLVIEHREQMLARPTNAGPRRADTPT